MNSIHHGWSLDEIAPEARRAAERAAEAAGMPLEIWLNQLIKYVSAMELSGKGPARARAIDETIKRAAAEQARMGPVDAPAESGPETPMMLDPAPTEYPTTLPAEVLEPNRFAEEQPGERDVEQAIGEWRKSGALAPLVVRPDTRRPGHYEIVNGMERWHAASRLHMRRIPVTVRELSDEEVLRATLIQKLALKSLPPLDEAQIYQRLMEETGLSVAALSDVIGRSPTHVATALQLLELPQPVREMINSGELSVLHARTLLGAANPEPAAREVVSRRLDIYQTEQLVRASHGALTPPPREKAETIAEPAPAMATAAPAEMPLTAAAAEAPPAAQAAATPTSEMAAEAPAMETAPDPQTAASSGTAPEETARQEPTFAEDGFANSLPEPIEDVPHTTESVPLTTEGAPHTDAAQAADEQPGPGDVPPSSSDFAAAETGPAADTLEPEEPMILGADDSVQSGTVVSTSGDSNADALVEASPAIDTPTFDNPVIEGPPINNPVVENAPADNPMLDTLTMDTPAADAGGEEEVVVLGDEGAPFVGVAESVYPEPADDEIAPSQTAEPDAIPAAEPASELSATAADFSPATGIATGPTGDTSATDTIAEPGPARDGNGRDGTADAAARDEAGIDDSTRMVETHLSTLLGLKVSIAERNPDDGVLSIHYNSENELTDLVSRLNRMPTGRRAE